MINQFKLARKEEVSVVSQRADRLYVNSFCPKSINTFFLSSSSRLNYDKGFCLSGLILSADDTTM